MDFVYNPNFDATQDVDYWRYWWTAEKGDELFGSKHGVDPDGQSKALHEYHKALWSKKLPCGKNWDLISKKGKSFYFIWNDGETDRYYSSDSLLNSFRWGQLKPVLEQVKEHIENDLKLDYRKWLEDYVRKLYTMGGMIIFPSRKCGINSIRAFTKVNDRVDLTFECIRRWYAGEHSPMANCLDKDKFFLDLFVDFKGYIDFFLLQDLVSDDYKHVKNLLGEKEYCDDFFKSKGEVTYPQTLEEYMEWHDNLIDFAEKRNKRIEKWVKDNLCK